MCKVNKNESPSHISNSLGDIIFLTDNIGDQEKQKVRMFVDIANKMAKQFFGVTRTTFDIVVIRGSWEMELQVISRISQCVQNYYDITKSVAITDNHLQEIVIRYDVAKFGHYLHELIHAAISTDHTHQMREGLAWYFTLKLLERYKYTIPSYPNWVGEMYISPIRKMVQILGVEFLKDFAIGKASVVEEAFPIDVQELFLPEEVFYAKRRRFVR
jgi:hypothetical protein